MEAVKPLRIVGLALQITQLKQIVLALRSDNEMLLIFLKQSQSLCAFSFHFAKTMHKSIYSGA